MKTQSTVGKFVVYACLGFGAIVFGFPLLWMIVTSLTPAEQTLEHPPRLAPVAHYVALEDGRRIEVTKDRLVSVPSALVEQLTGMRAGVRVVVPREQYRDDDPAVRLIKFAEPGWWQVTQRSGMAKAVERDLWRDVVPPGAIDTVIKLRWENYPNALAAMGGRSLEEVDGFVDNVTQTGADAQVGFLTFLSNTLIVCVLGVIGTVLSNSIIAYGFARLRWRGRDTCFALTLATMMIPFPVLMVPTFAIFKELGWIGTLLPLWVPMFFGSAFHIFLLRQFFRTIPEELSEAARIDGCSEWRIFWRVILPLSRPVLAVSALFHFLFAWNDFLAPMLYLTRKSTFTLPLALQAYQSTHGGIQWNYLMAASAVTVIPIVVLFFFTQKTFIQGIATTGTKN